MVAQALILVEEQDYLLNLLILQDISFGHLLQFLEDIILQGLLLEDVRVQYEAHKTQGGLTSSYRGKAICTSITFSHKRARGNR